MSERPTPTFTTAAMGAIWVFIGGVVGTILRTLLLRVDPISPTPTIHGSALFQLSPSWTSLIPWALLAINFVGVFLAAWLLGGTLKTGNFTDPWRLVLITGLLGGLTSYSGLFVDFDLLWGRSIAGCLCVAVSALGSGVFAAWFGLKLAAR